jgi:hypothetical protein
MKKLTILFGVFAIFAFFSFPVIICAEVSNVSLPPPGVIPNPPKVFSQSLRVNPEVAKKAPDIAVIAPLYDYYEMRHENGKITVMATFYVQPSHIDGLNKKIIEKTISRYLTVDKERGVDYYMFAIMADPNIVIQFSLSGKSIDDAKDDWQKLGI